MNRFSFFALVVVLTFSEHVFADPPTSQEVKTYWRKMVSHQRDFLDIGKELAALDRIIASEQVALAELYAHKLTHIQDLLLIASIVQNEADKQRIKPVIGMSIKFMAEGVNLSIERVNERIAETKNPGSVAQSMKLRDDLRGLKELLLKF